MMMLLCSATIIWLTYESVAGLPIEGSVEARKFWITKVGPIRGELLDAQAIIVKDEEVPTGAECKPRNAVDPRYSDKRYLMCAGSILTSRYILTSASCIHEATHIRHNVRAPLAAMIAPFADTSQVIRILEFNIHPAHQVDPREEDHALHNVAIAKLACRISKPNLKEIKMPTQPISEYSDDDNCFVTVIKRIGLTSNTMYETEAKNVAANERDRRELTTDEIKETLDKVSFLEARKVRDTNWNESASRVAEISEKSNNQSGNNNGMRLGSKIVRSIGRGADKSVDLHSKNSLSQQSNLDKKLSVRESDGSKGCPQLGSAVICDKIQTSLVAVSCDDRQSETAWRYTHVWDNIDWINDMIGNWKSSNMTRTGVSVGGCQTCVYNFFIDYSCKDKSLCRKEGPSGIDDVKIPGIELPKCAKNHTEQQAHGNDNDALRTSFSKKKPKPGRNSTKPLNLAYLNAVNDMYTNKRSRNQVLEDDIQKLKSGIQLLENPNANERKEKNVSANPADVAAVMLPPAWLLEATSEPQRTPAASDYNDYFSELDASFRYAKATDTAEKINLDLADRFKGGKNTTLENFFGDDKYEEAGMPLEYADLYAKFLQLSRKSGKAKHRD